MRPDAEHANASHGELLRAKVAVVAMAVSALGSMRPE